MTRPPKNAKGPSATQRMEAAFWDCLREMPFEKITVRDIVERSKVNRNSFYYHYDEMWDLADAAVHSAMWYEFAHMLIEEDVSEAHLIEMIEETPDAAERFARLRLLAGPNGNQRLIDIMKNAIVGEWLNMFGLTAEELSDSALAAIDFVFGGMTALWAGDRFEDIEEMLRAIAKSGLITHNIGVLRAELMDCAGLEAMPQRAVDVEEPAGTEEPAKAVVGLDNDSGDEAEDGDGEGIEGDVVVLEEIDVEIIEEIVVAVEPEAEPEPEPELESEPEAEPEPEPEPEEFQMSLF